MSQCETCKDYKADFHLSTKLCDIICNQKLNNPEEDRGDQVRQVLYHA